MRSHSHMLQFPSQINNNLTIVRPKVITPNSMYRRHINMKVIVLLFLLAVEKCSSQSLVMAGGGLEETNADVWNKIIELAGGVGVAKIGVVAAASGTPIDSARYYVDLLKQYGAASADWIQIDENRKGNNEDAATIDLILSQTGFFFSGGDQARVINSFYHFPGRTESSAMKAIRQVFLNGGVIAGSSAGTACQSSNVMITSGLSYEALRYGAYPGGYNPEYPDDLSYDEYGGIGMVSGMVLDTHFSERGREGRLIRLVADTMVGPQGTSLGVGVDENTAFVIYDAGKPTAPENCEVLGAGGVFIADLSKATIISDGGEWGIRNVQTTYLTEGDNYDAAARKVKSWAYWKSNLQGNEYYFDAITSTDVFCDPDKVIRNEREFAAMSRRLWDCRNDITTYGDTNQFNPRFRASIDKSVYGAYGFGGYHPVSGDFYVSYTNMDLDISKA